MLWQYVTNSTQSALATNTSASHLQDRSARVEVCPWCYFCIPAATLCPGRRRARASTATVCVYSRYSVTEGEDVNGTAKFCVPWAISLEQFAINSVRQQFVSESVHAMLAYIHYFWHWIIASTSNCFPRLHCLYIILSHLRLPHTLLFFGKDSITTSYLKLNNTRQKNVNRCPFKFRWLDYIAVMMCIGNDDWLWLWLTIYSAINSRISDS